MSSSGHNTYGYGKTIELVIECHRQGMTINETRRKLGLSYSAVYNGAKRAGLVYKSQTGRAAYGSVKLLAIYESQSGLTIQEIADKHGLKRSSVRSANRDFKLGIKSKRKKQ